MSQLKINKNKEKIVKLLNENQELEYKLLLKKFEKTFDKDINFGTKKEPKMVSVTFGTWHEWFMDEDRPNEKGVRIERNMPIAVDGKPSNYYSIITPFTVDDIN